jgi:hypothetical protein
MLFHHMIKGVRWENLRRKLIDLGNDLASSNAIDKALQYEATLRSSNSFGAEKNINFTRRMPAQACSRCSRKQKRGACPAYKQKCRACGAIGHFVNSAMCRMPQQTPEAPVSCRRPALANNGRPAASASGRPQQHRRDVHETVAEEGRGYADQSYADYAGQGYADYADQDADQSYAGYADRSAIKRVGTVRLNNNDCTKNNTR